MTKDKSKYTTPLAFMQACVDAAVRIFKRQGAGVVPAQEVLASFPLTAARDANAARTVDVVPVFSKVTRRADPRKGGDGEPINIDRAADGKHRILMAPTLFESETARKNKDKRITGDYILDACRALTVLAGINTATGRPTPGPIFQGIAKNMGFRLSDDGQTDRTGQTDPRTGKEYRWNVWKTAPNATLLGLIKDEASKVGPVPEGILDVVGIVQPPNYRFTFGCPESMKVDKDGDALCAFKVSATGAVRDGLVDGNGKLLPKPGWTARCNVHGKSFILVRTIDEYGKSKAEARVLGAKGLPAQRPAKQRGEAIPVPQEPAAAKAS